MFNHGWFGLFAFMLPALSAASCALLLAAGCRQYLLRRAARDGSCVALPPPTVQPLFDLRRPLAGGALDVTAEVRDVLAQLATAATGHAARLEYAVQPDLAVHADRLALRAVMGELVGNAMRHAPGGHVLVSAVRLGGRVQIAVIDDGAGPDAPMQQAALREVTQLVALQGGTLDIEVLSGEGSTITVRLPEAATTGRGAIEAKARRTTEPTVVAARAAREAVAETSDAGGAAAGWG